MFGTEAGSLWSMARTPISFPAIEPDQLATDADLEALHHERQIVSAVGALNFSERPPRSAESNVALITLVSQPATSPPAAAGFEALNHERRVVEADGAGVSSAH
jgi:hypothetical protein